MSALMAACINLPTPDRQSGLKDASLDILEDHIASSKEKIEWLHINRLIDSTRFSNLQAIVNTYDDLRNSPVSELPDNWNSKLINAIKLSEYYFELPPEELNKHLVSIEADANFQFGVTLSESILLNGIYDRLVAEHSLFRKYRAAVAPGDSGFSKVYFIACLDSTNSEILLGHDSAYVALPGSPHKDIIKNMNGCYLVKPFGKSDSKGVIKFRLPNGAFEYYPFEIK